ncbi:copper-binding protein [Achromobacter dolens]|uniref:copper-binding protein n=1 Tax=Achromobacter dolens TaxID=1287738 RepID=UPI0011A30F8F|nr:copper-binding protein [Achromobacter dolens]MCZ8406384.1 copper-binding protein [Achromobacter dolens]
MKQTTLVFVAVCGALGLSAGALAADGMSGMDMGGMKMNASPAPAASSGDQVLTDAIVKQVDISTGMVTLQHGAVAKLGMPAMTMAYKAGSAALLAQAKAGAQVKVRIENLQGVLTIVTLTPQ